MGFEIEGYLNEIDAANPCGDDLVYDPDFIAFEQAIKGKPEQQVGDSIQEAEPPNWREVRKNAELLLSRSRDLRVLVSFLRSLIATEGFTGFNNGILLIKLLVEQHWDTIHPQLDPDDDNDPTERVNILMSLCDNETILRPLQQSPLIESKGLGRLSFRDVAMATGKMTIANAENAITSSTIDAAVQDVELENLQQIFTAISSSLDNLNALESFVTEQVGINDAPNFGELRNFLKQTKAILSEWIEKRGGGEAIGMDEEAIDGDSIKDGLGVEKKSVTGVINNTQDVIKALNLVCEYYKKYEPSSPIPMFIDRAIRLVGKNFMDVLNDIAPAGIDEAKVVLGKQDEDEDD